MDDLFQIPESKPRWKELAEVHGIDANIWYRVTENNYSRTAGNGEPRWFAEIIWFGELEAEGGDTEKEAVVALIHRLKLTGWTSVSIN
jgi:hypothetical protein